MDFSKATPFRGLGHKSLQSPMINVTTVVDLKIYLGQAHTYINIMKTFWLEWSISKFGNFSI